MPERPWRGPHRRSASSVIMRESVAIPAVRQKRSKLAPTSCHASFTSAVVSGPGAVIILFMALPFFVESAPRAYRLKGATPTLLFQHRTGHPRVRPVRSCGTRWNNRVAFGDFVADYIHLI